MSEKEKIKQRISRILSEREKQTFIFTDTPLTSAAVLLPIYESEGEYYILFTKRTEKLMYHKGQICFPGGGCHQEDETPLDTALREAFEEVGLRPEDVEVLGELDKMCTATSSFLITPFVGVIPYPYEFTVSADEIDELIEVPISALLDERNYYEKLQDYQGIPYMGSFFDYEGKVIWGATAKILRQFLDLVFSEDNV
jgi:8-oxo-dGTP pyrophosphatase MutT (NUDIX family)